MSNIDYEEGYFKLKKSNEDLTTLINKVINDFKQTKSQLLGEKDKNNMVVKRNAALEKQVTELTTKCDNQFHELEDLRDEIASMKTYTQAVEGVAENYCGKNMETESKYKKLKRQSTMMFSKLAAEGALELNIDELDDIDSVFSSSPAPSPPSQLNLLPVSNIADIKKPYEEKLAKEKLKKSKLREEIQRLKADIDKSKENIDALKSQLDESSADNEKIQSEMEILAKAHSILNNDHEEMMRCFSPFLKMKSENLELKRTSAFLLSELGSNDKIIQFAQIIDELKTESNLKDLKIKELESMVDSTALIIEISSLRLQLEDMSDKVTVANKERDKVVHENRILREQKGGPGIAAPPPPAPPPPPPPPPTNKLLKLFKGKHSKQTVVQNAAPSAEKQVLFDLMSELQRKLENKVKNDKLMMSQNSLPTKSSIADLPDGAQRPPLIKLRSSSVPCITSSLKKESELHKAFIKRKVAAIEERSEL